MLIREWKSQLLGWKQVVGYHSFHGPSRSGDAGVPPYWLISSRNWSNLGTKRDHLTYFQMYPINMLVPKRMFWNWWDESLVWISDNVKSRSVCCAEMLTMLLEDKRSMASEYPYGLWTSFLVPRWWIPTFVDRLSAKASSGWSSLRTL